MNELSAVIITCNEEDSIVRCLSSVAFAGEIVVVDSGSTDGTIDLASRYTERIFRRDWTGYASQKNFAIQQAGGRWILSVDADEEVHVAESDCPVHYTNAKVVLVGDSGVGFPEGLDWHNTGTLGMQLVITLTEQLDGEIELDRTDGTTFKITFPNT